MKSKGSEQAKLSSRNVVHANENFLLLQGPWMIACAKEPYLRAASLHVPEASKPSFNFDKYLPMLYIGKCVWNLRVVFMMLLLLLEQPTKTGINVWILRSSISELILKNSTVLFTNIFQWWSSKYVAKMFLKLIWRCGFNLQELPI